MTVRATFIAAFPEIRRISNFLERDYGEAGTAVSLDERADGTWSADAYFEHGEPEAIAAELRDWLGADGFCAPLVVEALLQEDWVAAGLAALSPVHAGRFIVHGAHDRGKISVGRIAIEIDAGQAFGTGHHATTAGCLLTLDRLTRTRRFANPLDLGTGSGVLAIALAKLLRQRILASDIDPVATRIAAENARLNRVAHRVDVVTATGVAHSSIARRAPFDLVVANILAEPLMRLASTLAPLVGRGGFLVLSGLLPHQRERVVAAYGVQGIHLVEARLHDGWAVLVLRKCR